MPDANVEPITCRSFAEAAGLALELHDIFGRYHAVLLLDDDGDSVDFHIFTEPCHQLTHAVCVATALASWLPQVARAVLYSEVDAITDLHEDDARIWHLLVRAFECEGVQLLDWIQTDAEHVRSLTISCDTAPVWQQIDPNWDKV